LTITSSISISGSTSVTTDAGTISPTVYCTVPGTHKIEVKSGSVVGSILEFVVKKNLIVVSNVTPTVRGI
jgi:hypothetical protein